MKTIIAVLVVATIAGAAAWHYSHGSLTAQPTFRTMPVMNGDLFIGVTATGTVEPVEIIDVGAQIVGCIKSFGPDPDKPGKTLDYCSRVKEGSVLAQLDDSLCRAELDKATANLRLAEAELKNRRAASKLAERAFARATELRGTNSKAAYEKAEADNEMAAAEMAMSEAKLEQAKVAKTQAEINLGYTVIRSPIDGVVIDRRVHVGQTVVSEMNAPSLFLLAKDLGRMLVCAAVNEADMGDIHVGQIATFTVDAYSDRTFSGKVSQIRLNASLQQNVVTYAVIVDVDNPDGKLLPYMTAKLQFEVARQRNVRLVPNQALRWRPTWSHISPSAQSGMTEPSGAGVHQQEQEEDSSELAEPKVDFGSPAVWTIANDGLVRPVPVEVGLSDGMVTEILSGEVATGDALVTGAVRKAEPDFVSAFVSRVTDDSD